MLAFGNVSFAEFKFISEREVEKKITFHFVINVRGGALSRVVAVDGGCRLFVCYVPITRK